MLCSDCKMAGQSKAAADQEPAGSKKAKALYAKAKKRHKRCLGGTHCDCQHSIARHALNDGGTPISYG